MSISNLSGKEYYNVSDLIIIEEELHVHQREFLIQAQYNNKEHIFNKLVDLMISKLGPSHKDLKRGKINI